MNALEQWAADHAAFRLKGALERKACLACEQDEHFKEASDEVMDGAMPNADPHEGPYCKKKRKR
jgi:hypothetical protein